RSARHQPERTALSPELPAADAEALRGRVAPVAVLAEPALDDGRLHLAHDLTERARRGGRRAELVQDPRRQRVGADPFARLGAEHQAMDLVLELADVSRPGVAGHQLKRLGLEARDGLLLDPC